MGFVDLKTYGLEFKHIISGPAPVGMVLNYVIAAGNGILDHRNGERTLQLFNYKDKGIGSAWCTEFMVGLGLCIYNFNVKGATPLLLTEAGKLLFQKIKNYPGKFNNDSNPNTCKSELVAYSKEAYELFRDIFKKSVICKNLVEYIKHRKTNTFTYSKFCEEYFAFFLKAYEGRDYEPNSKTATTANNRVPSLIQFCRFFDLAITQSTNLVFSFDALQTPEIMAHYVDKGTIKKEAEKQERQIQKIEDLVGRFGETGESVREVITRNSTVQRMFRNNLIARNGCECAICGKDLEEVLVASHIKPSKDSNIDQKIDDNNGLLLCATHDKLFDRYLISFDYKTGRLMYAAKLAKRLSQYELAENYVLSAKYLTPERAVYLLLHNKKFNELN